MWLAAVADAELVAVRIVHDDPVRAVPSTFTCAPGAEMLEPDDLAGDARRR